MPDQVAGLDGRPEGSGEHKIIVCPRGAGLETVGRLPGALLAQDGQYRGRDRQSAA